MQIKRFVVVAAFAFAVSSSEADAQFAQRRTLGPQCTFNDECQEPLVCAASFCRAPMSYGSGLHRRLGVPLRAVRSPSRGASAGRRHRAPGRRPESALVGCARRRRASAFRRAQPLYASRSRERRHLAIGRFVFLPIDACPCPQAAATAGVAVGTPVSTSEPPPTSSALTPFVAPGAALAGSYEFRRGDDSALWLRSAGGEWRAFGGVLTSEPSTVSMDEARSIVFARGTNDAVWGLECIAGKCGEWFSLGGALQEGRVHRWTRTAK